MTATDAASRGLHHHHDHSPPESHTDPVCGMSVDPATARHRAEHAGRDYFFCGARCRERFAAEPGRFVGGQKANAPTSAGAGPWTCPMHPEVVRDDPGACLICGM